MRMHFDCSCFNVIQRHRLCRNLKFIYDFLLVIDTLYVCLPVSVKQLNVQCLTVSSLKNVSMDSQQMPMAVRRVNVTIHAR